MDHRLGIMNYSILDQCKLIFLRSSNDEKIEGNYKLEYINNDKIPSYKHQNGTHHIAISRDSKWMVNHFQRMLR